MFETLGDFSIFFWSVATLLLLGIIFEERFLALEDKYDEWLENKRKQRNQRKKGKQQ